MILAFNGSPRARGNTAAMLQAALDGAASVGAETRLVQLYPLKYKGCVSCFSCKLKTGRHGHCAMKDELSPFLDIMEEADGLIFGSPIYFNDITPELLALEHRFLFSHMLYNKENRWVFSRTIPSAFIYTFGMTADHADEIIAQFSAVHGRMGEMLGVKSEICYSANAWQFSDYSLYEADRFDPAAKKKYHDEVFPKDCEKAFEMGRRLALMKERA
ncbi:flavodoxin family protein [Mailhella massiliensis]|uniref:Flavodoxin family protein n=1 Tax=Mailhella massiliensis TaxID=1903261 RepID=A0A921DR64_9BACT|nr:flavodoxin family protein [Mailhella massiliensis]HJD96648.1 flavodoxin family protein [Mailhella massiliensis]